MLKVESLCTYNYHYIKTFRFVAYKKTLSYRSYPSKQTITSWQKGQVRWVETLVKEQRASTLEANYMSNNGDVSIKNKADDCKARRIKSHPQSFLQKLDKASPTWEFHCRPNVDKFWKTTEEHYWVMSSCQLGMCNLTKVWYFQTSS